jgi:hypothetical protein
MIADFAIHDKGDGNPHAHILLTMRVMDEKGQWLPKCRKVYDLSENGERIRLPSGRWKCHKENTVDWNDQKYAEIWRQGWADTANRYLEANHRPERLDLRSYARQGIDKIPTVHMGPAACQMEKKGIQTSIGNLNRDISFGCGATGDVIDFVSRLHGIGSKEAVLMLAQDFSIPYEDRKNTGKPPIRPRLRRESEEQKFKRMERHCFRVLSDYYHLLRHWKEEHAPCRPDEAWNPRFVEALQNMSRVEYLMDVLLSGELPERASLITGHGKEARNLERRMAELTARDTAGTKEHGRKHRAAPER